jgi:hypothetical protein
MSLKLIMPDKEFYEINRIERAVQIGRIYFNILLPDPETGLTRYEKDHEDMSADLRTFIDANKEKKGSRRIYDMDAELYKAYKFQKILNGFILKSNTREGRKARLLENKIDSLPVDIQKSGDFTEDEEGSPKISETLDAVSSMRLVTMLETLKEHEITKTVNGIKLVLIPAEGDWKNDTLPLEVFCYTEDPIKVAIQLCVIKFRKKYIELEYGNEFRGDIFYAFINISPPLDVLTKFLTESFSTKEGNKKHQRIIKKGSKNKIHTVMQLRVRIKGIRPPIWRKLLVRSDTKLHDLHLMIQSAFGWDNYHLYEFFDGLVYYTKPSDEWESDPDEIDSTEVTIEDINLREGSKIEYTYDFGDGWDHTISVEKVLPLDSSLKLPACIGGKRNCPPEDCGGVYGYYDVLRKAANPDDPDHEATIEWLGEYNPEEFDLKFADSQVKDYKDIENDFI